MLEEDKVIIRKHGVGTFVNPRPLFTSGIEELSSVSTMIREQGWSRVRFLWMFRIQNRLMTTSQRFDYNEDDRLVTIKRVRTADGEPVVYCIDNVLSKNLPLEPKTLLNISIFDAIEKSGRIRIVQAVANIEPVGYDDDVSSILRCGVDVPLLVLLQQHYSEEGEMVLYSKNYFQSGQIQFPCCTKTGIRRYYVTNILKKTEEVLNIEKT